jgi:speckle-type POZ protein
MSPPALREMLRFLYTDRMENANIYAKELLMAANKYNIVRMKVLSEEALCQNLTDETVLDVAKFAHLHNGTNAKDFAVTCIVANFANLIKRPEWQDFAKSNMDLLHEIHQRLAGKLDSASKSGMKRSHLSI